uniref:Uncharacterized protein n=1 Tax=Rhizophora mucronata TaxID=61149 RepID=A0A2P2IU70_RHIMU
MDSSASLSYAARNVPKECEDTTKNAPSRRSPSFPSSSSLSSSSSLRFHNDWPPSPATSLRFSGVPFSWEHLPGIPKKPSHKKRDSTLKVLPLPPSVTPPTSKRFNFEQIGIGKKISSESSKQDPFFTALVECSKDHVDQESTSELWDSRKVTRSISDRFGFINLYPSCKRACAISESIVCHPKSSGSSYDLMNRPSR